MSVFVGDLKAIKFMMENSSANPNFRDANGDSSISWAVMNGYLDIL